MNNCFSCDFYEPDFECCTCPSYFMWYACPIQSQSPEGQKQIDDYIKFLQEHDCKN